MIRFQVAVLFGVILLAGLVVAQEQTRVRGTIAAFDGKMLVVKSAAGGTVNIQLADKTELVFTQPMKLAEIKPGDFLAVTSTKRDDGSLIAFEVRRFPKPLNPGHRPLDGRNDQTMTNATVSAMVQSASGRELTVTYDGGSQRIMVPQSASISMLVAGERSQLVPGAAVNLTAAAADDGKLIARRIQVSPSQGTESAGKS